MTNAELQSEFERKSATLCDMRENELIDDATFDKLMERVRNETFFAVSVLHDIANINDRERLF